MNTVGEKVKEILQKTKMSQQQLCDLTGISKSALSKYLSSDLTPRTEVLLKFSKALNVSVYTLLGKDDENEDVYSICKNALLARSGKELSDDEKKELINLILER